MTRLQLDIITPARVLISQEADSVNASGVEGEFGVLPGHAPLLAALDIGPLRFRSGDSVRHAFVGGGFLEVLDNRVTVLAEAAEMGGEIDVERAGRARERAEGRLARSDGQAGRIRETGGEEIGRIDEVRARAALCRALTRLRVAAME